jgi:hypothetical protein
VLSTHSFEVPGELRGAGSTRGSMYGLGGPWRSSERSPTSHLGHVCVGNLGVSKFARASLPGPKFRADGVGGTVRRDVRLLIPYDYLYPICGRTLDDGRRSRFSSRAVAPNNRKPGEKSGGYAIRFFEAHCSPGTSFKGYLARGSAGYHQGVR